VKRVFPILGIFLFSIVLLCISVQAVDNAMSPTTTAKEATPVIEVSKELRDQYPIKSHHAKLSIDCIHCHDDQGRVPAKFEYIGDKGCLSCHGSKEKMAKRTGFMDMFHTNPHNSYHDGPTLSCDECHKEHEPSQNRCMECHEKEVPNWMKKVMP